MSDQPIQRLLDDPNALPQLRSDLRHVRERPAVPYDAEKGLQRLHTSLRASDATGEAPDGVAVHGDGLPALGGHGLKWWGLAAVGLAALGAVWWERAANEPAEAALASRSTAAPLAVPLTAQATSAVAGEIGPVHEATGKLIGPPEADVDRGIEERPGDDAPSSTEHRAVADEEPGPHSRRASERSREAPLTAQRSSSGAARGGGDRASSHSVATLHAPEVGTPAKATVSELDPDARKRREIQQLARARRALVTSAQEALQFAREGQEQFPDGMFVEERSALIVFALRALGRDREAIVEGRQFLRSHPGGPFDARIRSIVEGQQPESAQ